MNRAFTLSQQKTRQHSLKEEKKETNKQTRNKIKVDRTARKTGESAQEVEFRSQHQR